MAPAKCEIGKQVLAHYFSRPVWVVIPHARQGGVLHGRLSQLNVQSSEIGSCAASQFLAGGDEFLSLQCQFLTLQAQSPLLEQQGDHEKEKSKSRKDKTDAPEIVTDSAALNRMAPPAVNVLDTTQ